MTETVDTLRSENAGPEELDRIVELIQLMHEEVGIGQWSEPRVRQAVENCLNYGAVVVAREDGQIVGIMGLIVGQWWYSEDYRLADVFTFVHPEYRRSRHARNLIEEADRAARKVELPMIVGVMSRDGHRTAAKSRLFARHLKPVGNIFLGGAP